MAGFQFNKLDITVLVRTKTGFKELPLFEMDDELYTKDGSVYLEIRHHKRTTNPSVNWIKFSNGKVPRYNTVGTAQVTPKWQKEEKRKKFGLRPKDSGSVTKKEPKTST